jgi:hypothetical protein
LIFYFIYICIIYFCVCCVCLRLLSLFAEISCQSKSSNNNVLNSESKKEVIKRTLGKVSYLVTYFFFHLDDL